MRLLKNILTKYIFKWMFDRWSVKEGEVLTNGELVFRFDSENGEPGNLKWYFSTNGFWNYIKVKDSKAWSLWENKYVDVEYVYKNMIDKFEHSEYYDAKIKI